MLKELKTLFAQQAEQELLQTMRDFHSCKQEEGQSVSSYVLKMKCYIENLERLGHPVTLGLGVSLILIGLRKEYDGFMQNYNMHNMGKTINELHAMLKHHEQTLPKNNAPALHAIRAGKVQKASKHKKQQPQMAARDKIMGRGKISSLMLPSPRFPLHLRGKILQRTQYVMSVVRHDIGRGIVLNGFINCFMNNTIQVSRNNMAYFSAIPRDGIFKIYLSNSYINESSIYAVSNKRAKLDLDSALLWHCRLVHISKKRIEKLQHDVLLNSTDLRDLENCVSCMSEKIARKPYTHQVERAKDLLELIHTDVCGPFKIMSRQGANYFVIFTDDFSQMRNITLLDMVRSMMSQTTLSKSFWDYAPETPARILNMVSTKKVEKTPYEVWHGQAPKLSYLKVWGCEALVKRDTLTKPDKLEPRSIKCIFIECPKETMGYSFYYPPKNKVLVARNAEFLENSLITKEASGSLEDLEIIQEEDTHPSVDTSLNHKEDDQEIDEPQSDINPIRRSTRTHHPTDHPEFDKWLNAMNVEMQSTKDNEVWILVELPPNGKTVGSKWLFKKKTDMDGAVHTYKARLVANGYTQTSGIDYEETFSPVADIRAIRILVAIAAYYDYEIWQMDVKTVFLNGYLSEEVYMEQPEGFVNPKYPNRVCKLKHFIYGLKQASRKWNK
nr:retrotransposon protein, putative, Ty1-copia subclass [Tanacetum cinerariifolium]